MDAGIMKRFLLRDCFIMKYLPSCVAVHCITRRKAERPALCKSGGAMRVVHGLTPVKGLALVCALMVPQDGRKDGTRHEKDKHDERQHSKRDEKGSLPAG